MRRRSLGVPAIVVACAAAATAIGATPQPPAPPSGAQLESLGAPPTAAPLAEQRIYFVLTDRYANGDPGNDRGGAAGARTATGFDPADVGWFHGGDFAGLRGSCTGSSDGLARIAALGFTAVWITPPFGQRTVQGDSAAYHGYWITDLTAPDRHLGTEQEFGAFVQCAHALGLKVILDVVVNHTGDVVSLTGGSGGYVGPEQVPYRDCRGRAFRPAQYVGKAFPCLAARFMPRVPLVSAADRNAKKPGWLNDPTRYHDRGDIDFTSCNTTCLEHGDFFGLDDLFTEREDVVRGLAEVYGGWIERHRIDGIRIDTARHVNAAFFRRWLPSVRAAARRAGVRDFLVFGEVFNADTLELIPYVRDRGLPTLLDFPLQDQLVGFASGERGARGIASVIGDDDYFQRADGVAYTPPTFLGNHDMGRVGLLLRQRSGSDATLLRRDLLAHSLLFLLRGAPVVYYGDEVGMIGSGGDKLARQDMFPTRVAAWRTEPRVGSAPIGERSSLDVRDHPVATHLRQLASLREAHPALAGGPTAVRLAEGPRLVLSRFDLGGRREYVAAFNAGTARVSVTIPVATPGSAWDTLLGPVQTAQSTGAGRLALSLAPLEAVVVRAQANLPARAAVRPSLVVRADDLTNLVQARATVATAEPVSVAFALKRGRTAWRRVAADGSPPYRGFVDPRRFRRGERVHVVALARWPNGSTTVSPVVATVPRPRCRK